MAAPPLNDGEYARLPGFFKCYSEGLHNNGIVRFIVLLFDIYSILVSKIEAK